MTRLTKKDIPFMKHRKWLVGVSFFLVFLSIFLWWKIGLNYGTDFRGGLKLIYQFKTPTNEAALTDIFKKNNLSNFVVQRFGEASANTFVIKSEIPKDREEGFSVPFNQALESSFGKDQFSLLQEEFVGPKVGKELRTKGLYAVVFAWLVMLIYIWFRFDIYFAPGAILALIHDVLLAIGAFALFGLEVNLTVVAAILTIIGYSINDTIIVMDRIREDMQRHKGMDLVTLVDKSINETLSRTIITSLTVFFVVVVLYFRTEGDIKNFAFAMMIGVITGTYSSISIASPIFLFLKQHGHRLGIKHPHKASVS